MTEVYSGIQQSQQNDQVFVPSPFDKNDIYNGEICTLRAPCRFQMTGITNKSQRLRSLCTAEREKVGNLLFKSCNNETRSNSVRVGVPGDRNPLFCCCFSLNTFGFVISAVH